MQTVLRRLVGRPGADLARQSGKALMSVGRRRHDDGSARRRGAAARLSRPSGGCPPGQREARQWLRFFCLDEPIGRHVPRPPILVGGGEDRRPAPAPTPARIGAPAPWPCAPRRRKQPPSAASACGVWTRRRPAAPNQPGDAPPLARPAERSTSASASGWIRRWPPSRAPLPFASRAAAVSAAGDHRLIGTSPMSTSVSARAPTTPQHGPQLLSPEGSV